MLLPREHGAWSILAQPFLSALILSGQWHPSTLAAAVAVVAVFLIRTPLVIIARQALVWREPHPETRDARRWAAICAILASAMTPWLAARWGWTLLLAAGSAAAVVIAVAISMEVTNRHRAIWMQLLTAGGLSASCIPAALSATGRIPGWCWILWLLCAAHSAAGILVVRARLEARIAARTRKPEPSVYFIPAKAAQYALLASGLAILIAKSPWIAAALILPSTIHLHELSRLKETINTPLNIVGLRALAISVVFSVLAICGLWGR